MGSGGEGCGSNIAEPVPVELDPSGAGKFLRVEKDKLSIRYEGSGAHSHDVGSIQANCSAPRRQRLYYFEVTVRDAGDRGCIGIGFAPPDFRSGRQPGWEPGSYGYHGDDGRKYFASGSGEDYGPHYGAGDTVGAGLHLESQEIFFTKNGVHLGTAFRHVVAPALVPTVGLHSLNEAVDVNFGSKPFAWDADAQILQERDHQAATIAAREVPAGVTHQLIRSYLQHFAYAGTLAAFDEAAGLVSAQDMATDSGSPELQLRHAVRSAIDAGNVGAAEQLLCDSSYAHLLVSPPLPPPPPAGAPPASPTAAATSSGKAAAGGKAAAASAARPSSAAGSNSSSSSSGPGAADAASNVYLHLSCQKFVELVREGRIDEAVDFGQQVLAPLLRVSPAYADIISGVFALIAYQDPSASPLAPLLSHAFREATADVVNSAVLAAATPEAGAMDAEPTPPSTDAAAGPALTFVQRTPSRAGGPPPPPPAHIGIANGGPPMPLAAATIAGLAHAPLALDNTGLGPFATGQEPGGSGGGAVLQRLSVTARRRYPQLSPPPPPPQRPVSSLQRLLAQLAVVQAQRHAANGGQGEVFDLHDHMAPPEVKPKTA